MKHKPTTFLATNRAEALVMIKALPFGHDCDITVTDLNGTNVDDWVSDPRLDTAGCIVTAKPRQS